MATVAIVGAGIIGVTTALSILEKDPTIKVTVMADEFSPNTTSDGAAGLIMPHGLADTPMDLQRKWFSATMKTMKKLLSTEQAPQLGISLITSYNVWDKAREDPPWKDLVLSYRRMTEQELADYPAQPARFGFTFNSILAEGSLLIPWLMDKARDLGSTFVKRRITSISELCDYDVIVNCTGMGARELVGDTMLKPVRGQVVRIRAPWIKCKFSYDSEVEDKQGRSTYIIPTIESVVIGGTTHPNNFNTEPTLEDTVNIIAGASKIIPSIKNARVLKSWSGLRPSRFCVRLEKEIMKCTDKGRQQRTLNVIHNYGHGGAGLSLSFGCADHCSDLVLQVLANNRKSKL